MAENNAMMTKAEQKALCVTYEVGGNQIVLDLDFVKKYLVSGDASKITNQELMFYMNTCKMQKLNPLVSGESYLIKYGEKPAQLVIGKAAYLKRAFNNPNYLYKKDGIVVQRGDDIIKKQGCAVYPGEKLVAGWCEVYYKRNGSEYCEYKEVSLDEYNQGMANWKSKPATMLNKVSISQCLREAFPDDYEGLYSEDEMIASGVVRVDSNGEVITEPTASVGPMTEEPEDQDPIITQEQRRALFRTARQAFGTPDGDEVVANLLKDAGLENTSTMRVSQYGEFYETLLEVCKDKMEHDQAVADQEQDEE